jgi:hypothetical protein
VFVLLALSGLGWAAAHALAHRLMSPEAVASGMPEAASYLGYLPVSFALCMALALPLAAGLVSGSRWKRTSPRSLWLFGVVPVLGFVGHALAEPLIAGSSTAYATSTVAVHLVPVALVGLLVQIPFALAAVVLGRGLLALAETVARWLVGPRTAVGRPAADRHRPPRAERRPAFRLELGHSQRAPPSPVFA